jgi:hypothetical protein
MKTTVKIIIGLLIASSSAFAASNNEQVDITESNNKHVFVFKVEKEFRGGRIEVLSADGKRVTAQRLMRRKMIIDFCDVKAGVYTIVVKKDDQIKKFEFVNK